MMSDHMIVCIITINFYYEDNEQERLADSHPDTYIFFFLFLSSS